MTVRILSTLILIAACALASCAPLAGQVSSDPFHEESAGDPWKFGSLYGRIVTLNGSPGRWIVELSATMGAWSQRTEAQWDGAFEFGEVAAGQYRLRVLDKRGMTRHDELVTVHGRGDSVSITVRGDGPPQITTATISFQQLQHKVPKNALKEFQRARAAIMKQDSTEAVQHLKSALAIDPDFADAHNDLGVAYFALDQYQESVAHFQRTLDLAPTHLEASNNLCLVLLSMKRFAEAGQAAERVLERSSGQPVLHYAAGLGLLVRGGSRSDALRHLSKAEEHVPLARLVTAQSQMESGRRTEAARQLEAFLRSSNGAEQRREVEKWLAEVNQQ